MPSSKRQQQRRKKKNEKEEMILQSRKGIYRTIGVATIFAVLSFVVSGSKAPVKEKALGYLDTVRIVSTYPHEKNAFTQGLCTDGEHLFESDGLYGKSRIRQLELRSGKAEKETPMLPREFAEGLEVVGTGENSILLQLTWRERVMHEYDIHSLQLLRTIPQPFKGEGWGVTYDKLRDLIYFVDGSASLHTYQRRKNKDKIEYIQIEPIKAVTDDILFEGGLKIEGLNELEMVRGELWANIYPMRHHKASNCIIRLDPVTAKAIGWIDANELFRLQSRRVQSRPHDYVLNGIAFIDNSNATTPTRSKTYFTGKNWDYMYDVDIVELALDTHGQNYENEKEAQIEHIIRHCGLWIPPFRQQQRNSQEPPLRSHQTAPTNHHQHNRNHKKKKIS